MAGLDGSVWFINPDLLTIRIQDAEGLELDAANLAAVQRIETWLDASLDAHQTIGVETVLSSPKYRRLVEKAQERGFKVHFIYVVLRDVQMQLDRIALRVRKGGTMCPPTKRAPVGYGQLFRRSGFWITPIGSGFSTTASPSWA
ncbi:MAG: hypothetical protein JNL35_13170 [Sphingopyxis sp.]|nr:hypothetical protein [Sphingopyxis sp.]